jgi:ADP-ribose pyrophosphatase YjhB (NUDIX family)
MKRAVGIIILNNRDEVLLLQRSHQEDSEKGKWTVVGGTVKKDESYELAAVRQIREELNLIAHPNYLQLLNENHYSYDDNDEHHHVRLFMLLPRVDNIATIGEPHLTKGHRFVPKEDLHKYDLASYTEDDFKYLGWT